MYMYVYVCIYIYLNTANVMVYHSDEFIMYCNINQTMMTWSKHETYKIDIQQMLLDIPYKHEIMTHTCNARNKIHTYIM